MIQIMIQKKLGFLLKLAQKHRIASAIIVLVLLTGAYYTYQKLSSDSNTVRYVMATAEKDTLISSITGTGQTSTFNQIDIKPKISGDVIYVAVKNGDEVRTGALLAQVDARDAEKAVRDAEVNLESAKLSLEKMRLQNTQELRGDVLNKNYEDGLASLAGLYGEFKTILDGLDEIFFGEELSSNQESNIKYYSNYSTAFRMIPLRSEQQYIDIKSKYSQGLADFELANRGTGEARSKAIQSGYDLTVKTAELIKTGRDVVRYVQNTIVGSSGVHARQATIDSHLADLNTYATTIDGI